MMTARTALAQSIVDLWWMGETQESIAEKVGTTPGTVRSTISRLRRNGYRIPRRGPNGSGWIDPVPRKPPKILPGAQHRRRGRDAGR